MSNTAQTGITIRIDAQTAEAAAKMQQFLSNTSNGLRNMVTSFAALAGIGSLSYMFAQAVKEGVAFNATIEQQTIAFKTLLGSMDAAVERIKTLTRFAATTPFELREVVNANRVLQTLTGGALAGEDGLRLVGDAAAAAGRDFQEVAMWVGRLYGGLQSGTPVGEATMRLLEMGLISGDTKRDLDKLAESGKGVGSAMEVVSQTFAKTSGAMREQAATFNGLASTFRDGVRIMLGEAMKPLFEETKRTLDLLANADWEGYGRRAGAFVQVVINAWKEGRFDEIIGLTISSGFEIAFAILPALFEKLGFMLISALRKPLAYLQASLDFIAQRTQMRASNPQGAAEMDTKLMAERRKYEAQVPALGMAGTIGLGEFKDGRWEPGKGARERARIEAAFQEYKKNSAKIEADFYQSTFDQILKERMEEGPVFDLGSGEFSPEDMAKDANERLKRAIDTVRNDPASSTAKLGTMIQEQENLRAILNLHQQIGDVVKATFSSANKPQVDTFNAKKFVAEQELVLKKSLLEIDELRAKLDGAFSLAASEKWALRRKLLQEEQIMLEALIQKLQEQARLTTDETEKQLLNQRADSIQGRLVDVRGAAASVGPDPNSFTQNVSGNLATLSDEMGTFSQGAASVLTNGVGSAINGISESIMGMIDGTKTWGQVFAQVGRQIISSMIQVVVNWIAQMTVLALLKKIFQQEEHAAAASAAAAWGPAAVAASIATAGAAAAIGTAAALAGMTAGAVVGGALGSTAAAGFLGGGYTGDGPLNQIAGVVHRREFVVAAGDVDRWGGPGNMKAMISGAPVAPSSSGGAPAASSASAKMPNVHIYMDKDRWLQATKDDIGSIAVDAVLNKRLDLGMNT
jgi:hypothetical protein